MFSQIIEVSATETKWFLMENTDAAVWRATAVNNDEWSFLAYWGMAFSFMPAYIIQIYVSRRFKGLHIISKMVTRVSVWLHKDTATLSNMLKNFIHGVK